MGFGQRTTNKIGEKYKARCPGARLYGPSPGPRRAQLVRPRLPSASQPEAEAEAEAVVRADALCTALHGVLRSAGFDLTDVADEQHAKVGPP